MDFIFSLEHTHKSAKILLRLNLSPLEYSLRVIIQPVYDRNHELLDQQEHC